MWLRQSGENPKKLGLGTLWSRWLVHGLGSPNYTQVGSNLMQTEVQLKTLQCLVHEAGFSLGHTKAGDVSKKLANFGFYFALLVNKQ